MSELCFRVYGIARPQGSKRLLQKRGRNPGRARMVEASTGLRPWRSTVARAALQQVQAKKWRLRTGPVAVRLEFTKRLPQKPKYQHPADVPDIDKLTRAVLDALTGVVYKDDALVVTLSATKRYGVPGVFVTVQDDVGTVRDSDA